MRQVFGPMTTGTRHAVVVLFLLSAALAAIAIFAAAWENHRADERWCSYLTDVRATTTSPVLRGDAGRLYAQFGCRAIYHVR
jgi:hypothetical protein